MNSFYPNGAIKGKAQFEKLLEERKGDLYLVNNKKTVFRIRLNPETSIQYPYGEENNWCIENGPSSKFLLRISPNSYYLESIITDGYIFSNFWHVWAYVNHLEQSGFAVDWTFTVGVG